MKYNFYKYLSLLCLILAATLPVVLVVKMGLGGLAAVLCASLMLLLTIMFLVLMDKAVSRE